MWLPRSSVFNFMAAVVKKSSGEFLCWSFFVTYRTLLTGLFRTIALL